MDQESLNGGFLSCYRLACAPSLDFPSIARLGFFLVDSPFFTARLSLDRPTARIDRFVAASPLIRAKYDSLPHSFYTQVNDVARGPGPWYLSLPVSLPVSLPLRIGVDNPSRRFFPSIRRFPRTLVDLQMSHDKPPEPSSPACQGRTISRSDRVLLLQTC